MRNLPAQTDTGTITEAAPRPVPTDVPAPTLWPLHLGAFLATFMFSVSNVAIPAVKTNLGAGESTSALVVGLFSAAFAAGLILCGRIGDRFGRRRLFTIGTGALVLVSCAVGLAPDSLTLLIARTGQGLAAAVMMPQILASFQHALTGSARLKALSLFGAFSGVGTVGGQVLGGGLISAFGDTWGWRAAFLSCGVVALAAFLGPLKLTESRSAHPLPLDVPGAILLGIGMVTLVIGLALGPVTGWLPLPAILLAASAALIAFSLWQNRAEATGRDPLIPPQVVRVPAAWIGMVMALLFFAGFGTFLYNFALTSQTGHGDPAVVSGLTLGLFAAAFLIVSLLVPRIVGRLGGPGTMILGTALQVVSLLGVAWASAEAPATDWNLWFQLPGLVLGAAQALQFGPLIGTVVGAVPDRVAGLSGGLISTMQQAGIAVGVALLGALFHVFTLSLGYDQAFAVACLVQIGLSLAFGTGAVVLLRLNQRSREHDQTLVLSPEVALD